MAEQKWLADSTLQTLSDPNSSLTNGSRWAFDYDNGTELDLYGLLEIDFQFDTAAPAEGDTVFEIWNIPGDGEGTEKFARGGDGTVGGDDDPAGAHFVGTIETRQPSTSVDEVGSLVVPLYPDGNRFVAKNVSGQTISLERIARMKPWKLQVA